MDYKNLKICQLTKLANRAKSVRQYDLANIVFAVLLRAALCRVEYVYLRVETQDDLGQDPWEVYYDLLNVGIKTLRGGGNLEVCVPMPLLGFNAAVSAMKIAIKTDRGEHTRITREAGENEVDDLWDELGKLVPAETAIYCIEQLLNKIDGEGQPFASRLIKLAEEKLVAAEPTSK